jgi:hypothetical protein
MFVLYFNISASYPGLSAFHRFEATIGRFDLAGHMRIVFGLIFDDFFKKRENKGKICFT